MKTRSKKGFAIAITWPEYMGKQTCSWYDPIMRWIGVNKNYHYRVGHASLVLINKQGDCYYFDCGRFHTPFGKGRIRDISTDPDLAIKIKARFSEGKLLNLNQILKEIHLNKSSKGEGPLKAAWCVINFQSALSRVKQMQAIEIFPFGPFTRKGTNCCRFVQEGLLAGEPDKKYQRRLQWLFPILPMPMTIINLLDQKTGLPRREELKEYPLFAHQFQNLLNPQDCYNKYNVKGTLPAPEKSLDIPSLAQWLGGEVYGSWFSIVKAEKAFVITRYAPEGGVECQGRFMLKTEGSFDIKKPFSFSYGSHCSKVFIIQDKLKYEFVKIKDLLPKPHTQPIFKI